MCTARRTLDMIEVSPQITAYVTGSSLGSIFVRQKLELSIVLEGVGCLM